MKQSRTFHYHFALEDGSAIELSIPIDIEDTGNVQQETPRPEWTKLDFKRCENCTYQASNYCPVALKLEHAANIFGEHVSHEKAMITVTTDERTYSKSTDIQDGLSSVIGLLMATSACPHAKQYFPAAWFHLPFASFEETLFRIVSVWLLRQALDSEGSHECKEAINAVKRQCENMNIVNKGIFERLKAANLTTKDAPFNAVAILNAFATMLPYSIDERLEELDTLFQKIKSV